MSDLRDVVDGAPADDAIRGIGADDDQGIASSNSTAGIVSNLVPTNANALAYSRSPERVLNIVYGTRTAVNGGGFFPAGLNGRFRTSNAN